MMKSYLDARPVFLQKTESIHGHFLICYLSVLLIRLLQFKVLKNKYCMEKLIKFIREFRVVRLERDRCVNITSSSKFVKSLADELGLPITNYFLNEAQINRMFKHDVKIWHHVFIFIPKSGFIMKWPKKPYVLGFLSCAGSPN